MQRQWLHLVTDHVALECAVDREALEIAADDATEILDLARIASHSTGDRTNAPLLCYVLGIAKAHGAALEDLSRAVREAADQGDGPATGGDGSGPEAG